MKGIIFQPELVRVLLKRGEIQTRRVVKPQPPPNCNQPLFDASGYGFFYEGFDHDGNARDVWPIGDRGLRCPYGQPGDRLWVRETFDIYCGGSFTSTERQWWEGFTIDYIADGAMQNYAFLDGKPVEGTPDNIDYAMIRRMSDTGNSPKPPIHMPRWASRITLQITDVRVERVQDITEDEAFAAGVQAPRIGPSEWGEPPEAVYEFMRLWDGLNAQRGYPWASNPFVWVLDLKLVTT